MDKSEFSDMRHLLVLAIATIICLVSNAQTKDVESWIYSDVTLCRGPISQQVRSMVDTGCSFCVIDSTYAAETFKISKENYIVRGFRKKRNFMILDSLHFCGTTYRKVNCVVLDLARNFKDYAPRFIVGGNILINGAWKFDLTNHSVEPYDNKRKPTGAIIHWSYAKKKKAVNSVMLKGRIGKQKVEFMFDTGSRDCKLPQGMKAGLTENVSRERADAEHQLQMVDVELNRNVHFKIGKHEYANDFFDGQYSWGLLNAYSFGENTIILNYKRQTIEVISEK